jgi:hypothetical protein
MTALGAGLPALAIVLALGGFPWRLPHEARFGDVLVRSFLAGCLVAFALLEGLSALGARWSGGALLAAVVAAQGVAWRRANGRLGLGAISWPGAGSVVAALAFAVVAFLALRFDAVGADFWAHWGVKSLRFAERGGVDFEFLRRPELRDFMPDYPRLWSDVMALPSWLAGRPEPGAALVFSLAAFGLVLVGVRSLLAARTRGAFRELWFAAIALAMSRFALTSPIAGLPDPVIALAAVLGASALLEPESPGHGRRLVLAAAVAAATKVEGAVLGALLLGLLLRARRRRPEPGEALAAGALWGAAVASWALPAWRLGLARDGLAAGQLDPGRLPGALAGMFDVIVSRHDLVPWSLAFLLLPALLWRARTRRFASAVALQLAAIAVYYTSGRIPLETWIATSFHRLVAQLMPALLAVVGVELFRVASAEPGPERGAATVRSGSEARETLG